MVILRVAQRVRSLVLPDHARRSQFSPALHGGPVASTRHTRAPKLASVFDSPNGDTVYAVEKAERGPTLQKAVAIEETETEVVVPKDPIDGDEVVVYCRFRDASCCTDEKRFL